MDNPKALTADELAAIRPLTPDEVAAVKQRVYNSEIQTSWDALIYREIKSLVATIESQQKRIEDAADIMRGVAAYGSYTPEGHTCLVCARSKEQRAELHKYLDSGEQMPMRSLVESALAAAEKSDSLAAENATLRNAQKACETCDAITMKEVAELREKLNREQEKLKITDEEQVRQNTAFLVTENRQQREQIDDLRNQLAAARKDGERLKQVYNEAKAVAAITPRPPNAITWEQGVKILDVVQLTLCPAIDAAIQSEGKL